MSAHGSVETAARVAEILERIRARRPRIHHVTNWVAMNDSANVTVALGALPVMSHARDEVAEMVEASGALLLNPGTLYPELVDAMIVAGERANEIGVPIIFDPFEVGATQYRNETADRIAGDLRLAVIRGNAGEVGALAGSDSDVNGGGPAEGVANHVRLASALARKRSAIVAITGRRDIVSDGARVLGVDNGHEMLAAVAGSGCMATSVVALFRAVEPDGLLATAGALATFGLAAEKAGADAHGPGSFRVALLDALYTLSSDELRKGARIVEIA